jgi:hypothetical protein
MKKSIGIWRPKIRNTISAFLHPEYLPVDIDLTSSIDNSYVVSSGELLAAWQTLAEFGVEMPQRNGLFDYFVALDAVLIGLNQSGAAEANEAALIHVYCLAEKADCSRAAILGGEHFAVDPLVVRDALANISNVLKGALRDRRGAGVEQEIAVLVSTANSPESLQAALASACATLSGFHIGITQSIGLSDYVMSLNDVLTALSESGGTAWVESVMNHVEYLADKAGSTSALILKGGQFSARQEVIREAVGNIDSVLQRVPPRLLERAREGVPADILALIVDAEATRANWNSREKALLSARSVLRERQQFVQKAITNINAVLKMVPGERMEETPVGIPRDVFGLILDAEEKLVGWCSREKAIVIARTVLQERPLVCVEIGVFGGRSLVPCAAALQYAGVGAIYGIEAWSPNVATENATNNGNDEWWSKVDFSGIKREFYRFLVTANLTPQVRIIEAPSSRAAALFDQIDFLHIDGSHSMVNATEDVILYARRVRRGGIIVFDDVNWKSTAPARELLATLCDTVAVLKDPASGLDIWAVRRRHLGKAFLFGRRRRGNAA